MSSWITELAKRIERDAEVKVLNLELDYMLLTLNDALLKNNDFEIKATKDRLYEICNELKVLTN